MEYINDCDHAKDEARDRCEVNVIETSGGFQRAGKDDERKHEALNKAGKKEERFEVGEDIVVN